MKINKTKILVPALAIACGAALVGSISGTAAWFQYSTKVTASTIQMSTGNQRNLKIKANGGDFKYDLVTNDLDTRSSTNKGKLYPVSMSNTTANDELDVDNFNGQPIYGQADPQYWASVNANHYLQFTLEFQAEVDGVAVTRDLYLADITLSDATIDNDEDATNDSDISSALRMHIAPSTSNAHYISNAGGSIDTHGPLDLNGDTFNDKAQKYEWQAAGEDLVYGVADSVQVCEQASSLIAAFDNQGNLASSNVAAKIGTTAESYVVTVWFEGWQPLGTDADAIWARTYAGIDFHVGLTFAIESELE